MDKKEILQKAQKTNEDEGVENAKNKGRLFGVTAFFAVYVVITVLNAIKDKPNDIASLLFMTYIAAESIPQYTFTKKKIYIVTAILGVVAAMLIFIKYIVGLF